MFYKNDRFKELNFHTIKMHGTADKELEGTFMDMKRLLVKLPCPSPYSGGFFQAKDGIMVMFSTCLVSLVQSARERSSHILALSCQCLVSFLARNCPDAASIEQIISAFLRGDMGAQSSLMKVGACDGC